MERVNSLVAQAIRDGDAEGCIALLKSGASCQNAMNVAAAKGDLFICKLIYRQCPDISFVRTLMSAAANRNRCVCEWVLQIAPEGTHHAYCAGDNLQDCDPDATVFLRELIEGTS